MAEWSLESRWPGNGYFGGRFKTKKAALEFLETLCKTYKGVESKIININKKKEG